MRREGLILEGLKEDIGLVLKEKLFVVVFLDYCIGVDDDKCGAWIVGFLPQYVKMSLLMYLRRRLNNSSGSLSSSRSTISGTSFTP
jgi:hypothetical protein